MGSFPTSSSTTPSNLSSIASLVRSQSRQWSCRVAAASPPLRRRELRFRSPTSILHISASRRPRKPSFREDVRVGVGQRHLEFRGSRSNRSEAIERVVPRYQRLLAPVSKGVSENREYPNIYIGDPTQESKFQPSVTSSSKSAWSLPLHVLQLLQRGKPEQGANAFFPQHVVDWTASSSSSSSCGKSSEGSTVACSTHSTRKTRIFST